MDAILPIPLGDLGPSEWLYLLAVAALVVCSFAVLLRPFANLALTIFFLASANLGILGPIVSASIAIILIVNCSIGVIVKNGTRALFDRNVLLVCVPLGLIAVVGLANGFLRRNGALHVLGDFYQALELPLLFLLTRALVTTEQQFRTLAIVLIASIIAASGFLIADAVSGATYVPPVARPGGGQILRLINNNDAVAFVALIGALAFARRKALIIAALVFVEVTLILSFTRGLWAAAAAAGIFLLLILPRARWTIVTCGAAAASFAVAFVFAAGVDDIAFNRIVYTAAQLRLPQPERTAAGPESGGASEVQRGDASAGQSAGASEGQSGRPAPAGDRSVSPAPEEKQTLSGRRRLEFILIMPEILAHPLVGKGLGATFQISGDAILQGPKGQSITHHFLHNLFLEIAFRLGIPALLIFVAVLWAYFRRAIGALRACDFAPENVGLAAGLIAAVFGELVQSFTSPVFFNHPMAGIAGCMMAMTIAKLHPTAPPANNPSIATSAHQRAFVRSSQ